MYLYREVRKIKEYLEGALSRRIVYQENMDYVRNIISGIKGEEEVGRWIERYTSLGNRMLRNGYLGRRNHCEVDFIFFSREEWFILEVKNYVGSVVIDQNNCSLNGKIISSHPIHQLNKTHKIIQEIANEVNPYVEVKSYVIFINEHSNVTVNSDYENKVIRRGEFRYFLQGLDRSFNYKWLSDDNFTSLVQRLQQYHYPAPPIVLLLN